MLHLIPQNNHTPACITFSIKAVPGGSRDAIVGLLGDALKVKVAAPPEGGKANKAICSLIAKALGVPKAEVSIESGHSHSQKRVAVTGVSIDCIRDALAPYFNED